MENKDIIVKKSFDFAIKIVNLHKYLFEEKNESVLSEEILKCGTSIGSIINDAQSAVNSYVYSTKLKDAVNEAHKTEYCANLLKDSDYISEKMFYSLADDCMEILVIINNILLTSKEKFNEN